MPDFEYNDKDNSIKMNTLGTMFGSSLEDFEACMAATIDKILELKKVSRVIFAENREYEYGWDQTKLLAEIASALDEIVKGRRLLRISNLAAPNCEKHIQYRNQKMQEIILDLMRRDPIGAYVEILREIRRNTIMMRKDAYHQACYAQYLNKVLIPIQSVLEATQMIQMVKDRVAGYHLGDRSLYRELFHPTIRPNFMLTRYMSLIPENARSVEKYNVGDTQVEIFRIPGKVEFLYHVTPPEFVLSDEKYALLDAARRYMGTHKPIATEFAEPERAREVFSNIGRDMIRELSGNMNVALSSKEAEELTRILARYTAGFGILEVLLADERIQDVFVNSPVGQNPIYIFHSDFQECFTNLIPTREDAESWATRYRILSGRPLDEANPVLDTEMTIPGGRARICSITRTLSPEGLGFAFRRHRDKPWTLPLFMKSGMLDSTTAGLLSFLVDGSASILVAGGRGAGKTSLLNALMLEIVPSRRIVSIEDTLELATEYMRAQGYNIERLKSRSVITRVETEMSADEALRTALRLGDSCLIVGEIRSLEAKALYEAMRIGALSNVVAGTIHGESAYGVYDRVVNDLLVPSTSFKATDIILICKTLKSSDGLHRFRRVTEITEVRKHWKKDPMEERGFANLLEYSASLDKLKPTDILTGGESEVINRIASLTKEWEGKWDLVWENIATRAKVKQTMLDYSTRLNKPEILEAPWVIASNEQFHLIGSKVREELGRLDCQQLYAQWLDWFESELKKKI